MKNLAAKRIAIYLIAIFVILFAVTSFATSRFASGNLTDDKHAAHLRVQNAQNKTQAPEPRVDGKITPDLIPDAAAYEILFRLLSAIDPQEEKIELRKSAYLRAAGFNNAEAAAISNAAYEYKRQVESLDTEADNIKNQYWPHPSQEVMGTLTQLQNRKEAIIMSIADDLQRQLNNYKPEKLEKYIKDQVKRKTKGFSSSLPDKKISIFRQFFSDIFTASAQAPGCDALVYMYNTVTIDWNQFIVFGSGSYSLPYNNCGHTVNLSTELWAGGFYATGGQGTYINLYSGGSYISGNFLSTTTGEGYCPVANQTFPTGSQTDNEDSGAYIIVEGYTNFSNNPITANGQASSNSGITLEVNGSTNMPLNTTYTSAWNFTWASQTHSMTFDLNSSSSPRSITSGQQTITQCNYRPWVTYGGANRIIKATTRITSTVAVKFKPNLLWGTSTDTVISPGQLTIVPLP
jgi:hypothetical protein